MNEENRNEENRDEENRDEENPEVVVEETGLAKIEYVQKSGICKYCKQIRFVKVPENLCEAQVNEIASEECDCKTAERMRERKMRLDAAEAWIENALEGHEGQQKLMMAAVHAVFSHAVGRVTIKLDGHKSVNVEMDKEDMIRIKTMYKDENEETF